MLKGIGSYASKLIFTIIVGLILLLIYHGINILLLLFTGALLAILWRGVSRWICRRVPVPFSVCLPVVVFLNVGSLVLFFWLASPNIAEQFQRFKKEIPRVSQQVREDLESSDAGKILLNTFESNGGVLQSLSGKTGKMFRIFTDTLGVVIDILLILVFGLFLVANPKLYMEGFLHLIPPEKTQRTREVILETKETLFRWFIGKILDMSSIFIMTLIGLWLLDMPLAFTFALIAFLFSFVPNIGPIISVIPPMAVAVLEGPNMPIYVGLLYLGIQLTESYFITPAIQKQASFVPPVLLLLVQFLFAAFMGVLGLLLATPILVGFMVPIRMLYVEDYLGDHSIKNSSV